MLNNLGKLCSNIFVYLVISSNCAGRSFSTLYISTVWNLFENNNEYCYHDIFYVQMILVSNWIRSVEINKH